MSKVEFTGPQDNKDNRGHQKHVQAAAKAANEGESEVNTILQGFMGGARDATAELHIYIDFERGAKFPYPAKDRDLENVQDGDAEAVSDILCGVYDVSQ